ncbi:MAG: sialate O-acetylesterase [Bacilli bacterium]|nr:sialate O-acetylesterase [Bacilli bacterium]
MFKRFIMVILVAMLLVITGCASNIELTTSTIETTTTKDTPNIDYKLPTKKFILNSLISNNMMFQRDKPIRIFGEAEPHTIIIVKLYKEEDPTYIKEAYTLVPESGAWLIELESEPGSFDQYILEITDTIYKETIRNVVFGDLYLTGGQSNMALKLKYIIDNAKYMHNVNERNLRIFYQDDLSNSVNYPYEAQKDVVNGRWRVANSLANIEEASAIGYVFMYELYHHLKVQGKAIPIGIINSARGGSSIFSWLDRDVINNSTELVAYLDENRIARDEKGWNTKGTNNYNQVSALYNSKIAPLTNFHIKGVIWYQGESNATYYPNNYAIPTLIDSWSKAFNRDNELLPFLLIQLHPYDGTDPLLGPSERNYTYFNYALHRQAQFETVMREKYKKTTVIIPIYDVDLTWQVIPKYPNEAIYHPLTKAPIGVRTAKAIATLLYEDEVDYLPPIYKSHTFTATSITIEFDHYGDYLTTLDGKAYVTTVEVYSYNGKRSTIAGEIIEPNKIRISNVDTSLIEAISYSNFSRNEASNLANSLGIPAIPFKVNLR